MFSLYPTPYPNSRENATSDKLITFLTYSTSRHFGVSRILFILCFVKKKKKEIIIK